MTDRLLTSKQIAIRHSQFVRRYLLRQGCEFAQTADEIGLFEVATFLESLPDETKSPQSPIAKITVQETGWKHDLVTASLYAPGLPPGEYDVYLDPTAPGLTQETKPDPYKAVCQGGTGGKCTDPDCEKCWPDQPEKALPDSYKATCDAGTGGPCTQPDCERCWDDEGNAVNGKGDV